MRKPFYSLLALIITSQVAMAQTTDPNLGIIPAPKSISIKPGQFVFSREYGILYENQSDMEIAQLFKDYLKSVHFLDIPVAKNFVKAPAGIIRFSSADYKGQNPEGYTLTITPKQINVSGKGAGLFYGLQTLMQLFPLEKEAAPKLTCAVIEDEPRYQYRGMHLDVCRHMFPVQFIKKYIDLMAAYKLNNFHWHLTDDQGWRIEIKKYPKLAQVGGYRAQTLIGYYHDRKPQWFDGTAYGGYYTQQEAKEIVAYAAKKYINVIPEIELPGHALAALAAFPELACGDNPGPFKTEEKWGVFDDVFCAGKDHTFDFLENVLTEVIAIFPSTYIHIGGDESPKTRWKTCPYCQKRISDLNLKDEHELQSYFIQRIEKFVNGKGRSIIGWDEILEGGLAPNATVMSWRGTKGGIAAAQQKHHVIMTPSTNGLYFDHKQSKSDQEPVSIGGFAPISKVYAYDPTPENLKPDEKEYILGVQANIWTEYIKTPEKVEYTILPRMFALSEIAWTPLERKNFRNLEEQRMPVHLARLDKTTTAYRVPNAFGAKDTTINVNGKYTFNLKPAVPGSKIYYSIDGYTPDETTLLYEKPFDVIVPAGEYRPVKVITITPSNRRSTYTTTTLVNQPTLEAVNVGSISKGALKYYYVPGVFNTTAQVNVSDAAGQGTVSDFSIDQFKDKSADFGLVYDGYIRVNENAVFEFSIQSADGASLYLDDRLIVNNDGNHPQTEKTGSAMLRAGLHKFKLVYFNTGGNPALKVFVKGTDGKKIELPAVMMFN